MIKKIVKVIIMPVNHFGNKCCKAEYRMIKKIVKVIIMPVNHFGNKCCKAE